ncbi:MAG: pyridoxal phosphate-dependent aminotransferase [Candidatus Omnitrophota bacterium]
MEIAKRLKDLKPSQTLQITAKAKQLKKEGKDIINFAAGEPDFDTPQKIKDAAIKAIQEGFTKYTPESGIPELRGAISSKFKKDNSLEFTPEQIVVSCGAKHSIYNSLQALINPADEVIVISPYWLSYPHMVRLAGAIPVILETFAEDGFRIDFDRLEKIITKKTKLLIINSPSNPTGCVYSKEELEKIAKIAISKDIWIISDEIYEKLIYDGNKHISIASLGNEIYKKTITVNGVSKTYSMTGWRIGYLGAPLELAKAISMLQSHSTSHPTSISQKATIAALNMQDVEIAPFVNEFKMRRDCLIEKLSQIKQISFFKPKGAFYCFVDISSLKIPPAEFASRLLEEEFVAVIPAESFGSDKHIRLSFATSKEDLIKGAERIKNFISKLV